MIASDYTMKNISFLTLIVLSCLLLYSCKSDERRTPKKKKQIELTTHHQQLVIEDSAKRNFIPEGYAAIKWITGTSKNRLFHYVVYVDTNERTKLVDSEGFIKRTLLVLEESAGTLKEIIRTETAVECIHCSHLGQDAFLDLIAIEDGFQLVFGMSENQYWQEIKTFIYDGNGDFNLSRDQYYIFNDETSAKQFDTTSVNYKEDLNTTDFGMIKLSTFNIYNESRR